MSVILNRIHHTNCPSCSNTAINKVFDATDHSVTGDVFEIWECKSCSLRFTQDAPDTVSIARYYQSDNYISHSNTSAGIVNRLYHVVRKITIQSKRRIVEKYAATTKGDLLDVGAGTGVFSASMKNAGWQVTALEPDANARRVAMKEYNIELIDSNELFHFSASQFDAITLWHVLEHIHSLKEYLSQLKKVVRANGCIIIAVPNYLSFDQTVYKSKWAAYDVPRHLYHFTPTAMKTLLAKHGMRVTDVLPMWFDSFYVSLLSEKYKNGKGNFVNGFVNGLISNFKAVAEKEKCSSLIYIVKCT